MKQPVFGWISEDSGDEIVDVGKTSPEKNSISRFTCVGPLMKSSL